MAENFSRVIINAPASLVWRALMDASIYGSFDPELRFIEGRVERGADITFHSNRVGGRPTKMHVSKLIPMKEMVLGASRFFKLYRMEFWFYVVAKDDATCELKIEKTSAGPLALLLGHRIEPGFSLQEFSKGLKRFIESLPRSPVA